MRKTDPDELKKRFFRTIDRFFQVNGQWYFSAREGDIGPFRSRQQARREAAAYIAVRRGDRERYRGAEPTVIPGYVYRSVLSMEQQVSGDRDLVLQIED